MSPSSSTDVRHLAARLAAEESWSQTVDRSARTEPARRAFLARFEAEVDPLGELDPAERARRAKHALKAHYLRMALASAKARRERREAERQAAEAAELDALEALANGEAS